MLKRFIFLLNLSIWILFTNICFAEMQSPDKIISQVYLGQSLEEIQEKFVLQEVEYKDEKNIKRYDAFFNPLVEYNFSIKEPVTLDFYNSKLSDVRLTTSMDTPQKNSEIYNQWVKLVESKWGKPLMIDNKINKKIAVWINDNIMISIMYINFDKLEVNKTAILGMNIDFLLKDKEIRLK